MRSLRGRIGVVLLVFGMTTLLAVGGALWFVLRDLHRDAALASLAELSVPYSAQARARFSLDILRPMRPGDRPEPEVLRRFRESQVGRRASQEFSSFVAQAQEEIDAAGISVLLVQDDAVFVRDPASGSIGTLGSMPDLTVPDEGGAVRTGTTFIEGLGQVLYAATPVRSRSIDRAIPSLVLAREDDSAQLATADLVRALSVAAILLLAVGIPLAIGLSRSVTGPLRRLAAASGTVARGEVPEPIPTTGPSEVAHASEAFNAMASEVTATREAQRQLLADVRHDLRTPLTVIAGFAQALRDGTAEGPTATPAADAIADEAQRLERMLDGLDQLTMPGAEGRRLQLETLDGLSLARDSVDRFAASADGRGQELSLAPGGLPATLVGDRDAVERILGNIVANALTHAPAPGGHVHVEVRVVRPGDPPVGGRGGWSGAAGVVLAVADDGPGIPAAALSHVFDRFYRGDPSRTGPGSGLGLAIVRDLAEALSGRAFAENLPGGGARVGVVLPAAPSDRASTSSRAPAEAPGTP